MRRGRVTAAAAAPYRLVATPGHGGTPMVSELAAELAAGPSLLVALVVLVDGLPQPDPPPKRGRRRPCPRRSVAWGATWCSCSARGRRAAARPPSTARCCRPTGASGTGRTARR